MDETDDEEEMDEIDDDDSLEVRDDEQEMVEEDETDDEDSDTPPHVKIIEIHAQNVFVNAKVQL